MKDVIDIFTGVIFLAVVAVIVKSANSAKIIGALGTTFNGSLQTAQHG